MSFILDALKKSEQERKKEEVPGIASPHPNSSGSHSRPKIWPWILLLASVNAGLLLWYFPSAESVQGDRPMAPESRTATLTVPHATAVVDAVAAPISPEPVDTASQTAAAEPSAPTQKETPPPEKAIVRAEAADKKPSIPVARKEPERKISVNPAPPPAAAIPRLKDLSPEMRRLIPELTVSLHYFTKEPASRLARINGRNLREKQQVTDDLVLDEITPSGIVLEFRGQRFTVGGY